MGAREVEFLGRGYIQPGSRGAFRTNTQSPGISPDFTTLILIGSSDNGFYTNDTSLPNSKRILELSTADEARSLLGSGDLADAVINAFSPSKDSRFANGPQTIKALNVSKNLSASVSIPSITSGISNTIKAQIPGPRGNQIRFRITNNGTIIQIGDKDGIVNSAPIEANEFRISYTGNAGVASLTFDGVNFRVILSGTPATDGSADLSVLVKDYETISELVGFINSRPGYSAVLLSQPDRKTKTLDFISSSDAIDIKTGPYTLRSLLYWQEAFFLQTGSQKLKREQKENPARIWHLFHISPAGLLRLQPQPTI
ncbi:hypothetical protein LEP1GSC108_3345 [Leptospira weilii str. UI 13098]|uniref:Uncharacterized protein n=1 Tax=Leptospira weilii str. UI 13098 TaxID=1088542 RepID=M6Q5P1_9LEPT|nr:hypothetical protein LEP1GSC108_3345 [Leptospira weilii str. UI 13098]